MYSRLAGPSGSEMNPQVKPGSVGIALAASVGVALLSVSIASGQNPSPFAPGHALEFGNVRPAFAAGVGSQNREAKPGHIPGSENRKKAADFSSIPQTGCGRVGGLRKMDNIIEARELQIERKHFYVELRENDRGRFLRITEEAHGRRNSIIVPSTGVDDFTATIAEVLTNGEAAPA
jgi:hypothetical protein